MNNTPGNPRILIVTPEVTYLPEGMGNPAESFSAKAGGLADVSAALISALFEQGADVHVALPDYRAIFVSFFHTWERLHASHVPPQMKPLRTGGIRANNRKG